MAMNMFRMLLFPLDSALVRVTERQQGLQTLGTLYCSLASPSWCDKTAERRRRPGSGLLIILVDVSDGCDSGDKGRPLLLFTVTAGTAHLPVQATTGQLQCIAMVFKAMFTKKLVEGDSF